MKPNSSSDKSLRRSGSTKMSSNHRTLSDTSSRFFRYRSGGVEDCRKILGEALAFALHASNFAVKLENVRKIQRQNLHWHRWEVPVNCVHRGMLPRDHKRRMGQFYVVWERRQNSFRFQRGPVPS